MKCQNLANFKHSSRAQSKLKAISLETTCTMNVWISDIETLMKLITLIQDISLKMDGKNN